MGRYQHKKIVWVLFVLLSSSIGFAQSNDILAEPLAIKISAPATEKWHFLEAAVKDKRIVALGESLHGVKEYNIFKLEIIKYLHEQMGFNVIAIESDLAMNFYGNIYRNQIPDTLLLEKLITPVWHTETHLHLIKYLKSKPNLKIIGFDLVNLNAINEASNELQIEKTDAIAHEEQLIAQYAAIKALYKNDQYSLDIARDSIMAHNLSWIINDLYPDEKIIISAANDHISQVQASKYGFMGKILSNAFEDQYFSIGFFHALGNPTHFYRDLYYENDATQFLKNSIQAHLLALAGESYFIHLQNIKDNHMNGWINSEDLWNVIQTGKYKYPIKLSKSFDALIWIKNVSPPNYVIDSKYHNLYKR